MTLHNEPFSNGGSRRMQFTLSASAVQSLACELLRHHLCLSDYKRCPVSPLLAALFTACSRLCSLFAACSHLRHATSHETVRKALHANLPAVDVLEHRLNLALAACISRTLRRHLRRARR